MLTNNLVQMIPSPEIRGKIYGEPWWYNGPECTLYEVHVGIDNVLLMEASSKNGDLLPASIGTAVDAWLTEPMVGRIQVDWGKFQDFVGDYQASEKVPCDECEETGKIKLACLECLHSHECKCTKCGGNGSYLEEDPRTASIMGIPFYRNGLAAILKNFPHTQIDQTVSIDAIEYMKKPAKMSPLRIIGADWIILTQGSFWGEDDPTWERYLTQQEVTP
jgi:hypothetical protein